MFRAALFITSKTWKQATKTSFSIDKLWYIQTVEYYSALSYEKTWTKLKCIAKRKKPPEKATYCRIPTTGHYGKGKTRETIKRSVAARSWNEEMNRQNTEDFLGNANTLYDIVTVNTCHYTFVQTH